MSEEMQFTYKDHILVCDNHLNENDCNYLISYFKAQQEGGFLQSSDHHLRQDKQLYVNDPSIIIQSAFSSMYVDKFWQYVYPEYVRHNPIIESMASHSLSQLKIQQTMPKGGFHNFHMEAQGRETALRVFVIMTYLNDVQEGGSTEFVQQSMVVKPKAGRTVLWPAAFTHPHRGNPPYSGDKYIITGWVEFM